ncbi:CidA/LrgA family protein [Alicyclobacillus dauci]|uniref:CidA/LrgA family holin-like protein n=1 Tax=Alicyclobacillus dauci TaxID=1475485 RepID=A0ABY6YZ72_9BACL|nr:CidA/LrgA family holin-like protein [Alicyclobacillus dauci]WAH35276.1 CidA/LrgA family holin-like protein [Alicyclobacillus dauci]
MRNILGIGILVLMSLIGDAIAIVTHIKIPGSIIGLVLLLLLLQFRVVRLEWVQSGANVLLSQMLLFFVPSAVGVIQYLPLMQTEGLRLVLVIALSTIAVMIVSGGFTELFSTMKARRRHGH